MHFNTSQFESVISDCISLDVGRKQGICLICRHLPIVLLVVVVVGKLVDSEDGLVVSETTRVLFTRNFLSVNSQANKLSRHQLISKPLAKGADGWMLFLVKTFGRAWLLTWENCIFLPEVEIVLVFVVSMCYPFRSCWSVLNFCWNKICSQESNLADVQLSICINGSVMGLICNTDRIISIKLMEVHLLKGDSRNSKGQGNH